MCVYISIKGSFISLFPCIYEPDFKVELCILQFSDCRHQLTLSLAEIRIGSMVYTFRHNYYNSLYSATIRREMMLLIFKKSLYFSVYEGFVHYVPPFC